MTQAILAASNALHIDAVLDFFRSIKKEYIRQKNIRSTMRELHKLSNRELWDIGISRCDIYTIAHDSFPAETNKNLGGWV
jgi:uncharacterized protein YjiS (DUF1127 family)